MSIKAILFDLDGTLLPMDTEQFTNAYFKLLAKKLAPLGYDPEKLISAIWKGTKAMVANNGEKSNETVFWEAFASVFGEKALADADLFNEYYRVDFQQIQKICGYNDQAAKVVRYIKQKGLKTVLATNPIFPDIATRSRIKWAGLDVGDFEFYTTYENSYHCKPNLEYYKDILNILKLKPEECLMVGNDVSEDMVAENLNMNVFLLNDCLLNKENKDISRYQKGSFKELLNYIDTIL